MSSSAQPRLVGVVVTTLIGVAGGCVLAGYLLLKQWGYHGPDFSIPQVMALYVGDAAVVLTSALMAFYWRYRTVSDVRAGVTWVGLGLAGAGILSMGPAIAFAAASGFSNEADVAGVEVGIVAACCLVGICTGGQAWLATRRLEA